MKRNILSLFIIFAVVSIFIPVIGTAEDDRITLIVELKGDAVLETDNAAMMGASEYNETDESQRRTAKLLSVQENVQSGIKRTIDKNAEVGFTYTNVLNGFSISVDRSHIDKIKALPEVENVYIAGSHKYINPLEPEEMHVSSDEAAADASLYDSCCEKINVPYMHELGYKGQGQAIVVIDSELDINHEFFSSPIDSPKYSKADIARLIGEKNLNVKVSANQVWKSDKIPFAYSYAKNNADVYSTFLVHGSHVCGIAAGKEGSRKDGTKFSGAAPEAQIIFMGVLKDSENLPDDAIIAAIDDASKMDIAAINMSLGADYTIFGGGLSTLFERVINNAVNAGIEVCAAAGNAERHEAFADNIDYSASGLPAVVSASTSVAAVQGSQDSMCWFSSWGTDTSLELKPEITTPGGSIYSSIPDDQYAVYSGTSMATPHMTGASVLMRQYIEENYKGKYENPARFIENLTMTGAKISYKDKTNKIPYSPRNQGAGVLDLKAAATTPIILVGADGKSKISLKDRLTDTFKIGFTARNFTDNAVTYDTINVFAFTDSYTFSMKKGKNTVANKLKKFNTTSEDMPENVTIPANSDLKISFNIQLDSKETAENLKIFTNGFFIDGFIELSDSGGTVPDISIPYTGFYGDWTAAPAFETPYFRGADSQSGLSSHNKSCICSNADKTSCEFIGRNQILQEHINRGTIKKSSIADMSEYDSEDFAGISPNGDGIWDILCVKAIPYRPLESCRVHIENDKGEIMNVTAEANSNDGFAILKEDTGAAPPDKYDKYLINCADYNDLSVLPDGEYRVRVCGRLPYVGAADEEISMKFYVDTASPIITKKEIRETDGKTYIDLSISDNRYVMGAKVNGKKSNGLNFEQSAYTKAAKTADVSIDITGFDISTLKVTAYDYAYNKAECDATGDISVAMPKKPVFNGTSTLVSFDVVNENFKAVTADIIAAVYDDTGALRTVSVKQNELIPEGASTQVFSFAGSLSGGKVKVFVWDKLQKMNTLGDSPGFELD